MSKPICDPRPRATLESNRIDNLCSFSAVIIRVQFNTSANFVMACFLKNNNIKTSSHNIIIKIHL